MKTIKVKDLMAISGKGGLYRFLAQARNGIVVESLTDKKRTIAPPTARVSALEDISIFTDNEDLPLADVLLRIHEKEAGGTALDPKSGNEALKAYFAEVLPEYDEDRVYVSDIKKVMTWYNLLHELGLLEVVDAEEAESDGAGAEDTAKADQAGDAGSETNADDTDAGKENTAGKKAGAQKSDGKSN